MDGPDLIQDDHLKELARLQVNIAAVERIHTGMQGSVCDECENGWPCWTLRLLMPEKYNG